MSNQKLGLLWNSFCALLCGLIAAASAQAATIPTYEIHGTPASESANQVFWPAIPNLLNGSTVSGDAEAGGSLSGYVDGSVGTGGSLTNALYYNGGPKNVLIVLPTPSDIGRIRSLSGWEDDRVNQSYDISYTTDLSPTLASTFTLLGTAATPYSTGSPSGSGNSVQVTFGGGTTSIVGGGLVTALKLVVANLGGGNPVYREIEAFAPVPEPASLGLLATGAVALLLRRRRK